MFRYFFTTHPSSWWLYLPLLRDFKQPFNKNKLQKRCFFITSQPNTPHSPPTQKPTKKKTGAPQTKKNRCFDFFFVVFFFSSGPSYLEELISPRQGLLFGNCGKDWDLGGESWQVTRILGTLGVGRAWSSYPVGGFNPFENISQIGSFPQVGRKIKKMKRPPSYRTWVVSLHSWWITWLFQDRLSAKFKLCKVISRSSFLVSLPVLTSNLCRLVLRSNLIDWQQTTISSHSEKS